MGFCVMRSGAIQLGRLLGIEEQEDWGMEVKVSHCTILLFKNSVMTPGDLFKVCQSKDTEATLGGLRCSLLLKKRSAVRYKCEVPRHLDGFLPLIPFLPMVL